MEILLWEKLSVESQGSARRLTQTAYENVQLWCLNSRRLKKEED